MYIEALTTPHNTAQNLGTVTEPFVSAAGLSEAREYLQEYRGDTEALFEVIDHVTKTVRNTLHYYQPGREVPDTDVLDQFQRFDAIEGITESQTTHCAGLTIAGSEAFETIGIEHYLGYMSGHWFLIVPYVKEDGRQRVQLVDMYKPESRPRQADDDRSPKDIQPITQDITEGLSQPGAYGLVKALRQGAPIAARLDLGRFAANLSQDPSGWDSGDYRWLDPYGSMRMTRGEVTQSFIMTAYAPVEGRVIAEQWTHLKVALARGETQKAADCLSDIAGRYPEINARAPHNVIGSLVMGLCAEGQFRQAGQAIDEYFNYGHSLSQDPRLSEIEGDLWRHVTHEVLRAGLVAEDVRERARRAYETAAQRTKVLLYQAVCVGKVATL
jgi:hypothetical protein